MLLGAMVGTLAGCGAAGPGQGRSVTLAECRLAKLPIAAQCGTVEVAENRSVQNGRKIRIAVAVLAANTLNPLPDPLFILAGGPGQAASSLGPFAAQFTGVRRQRDIVLVDQRGTGRSAPLDCAAFKDPDAADAAFDLDPVPRATECAKELAARGVDVTQYTTAAWIADLDEVRAALGYERVNLWGGSYGSRAALEYVRRFPQHVRSMVLDGVAPPSLKVSLDVWPTRAAAIDAVFAACARSPSCQAGHGDLRSELNRIDERLGGGGEITIVDPRTGEPRTMQFTLDHVVAALQALVYVPELAALAPEAVHLAGNGDAAPLFAAALALTHGISEQVNTGLYYADTCTEDAPRITPEERETELSGLPSRAIAERGLAVCQVWPHGERPAGADQPVVSDVPTLLLSGGLDPVTPPRYADEVAKTLKNSRHVVAAGYGHNVSPHACAPRLIAAFVDDAGFARLPADCVQALERSTRPPLWPDRLGPQP